MRVPRLSRSPFSFGKLHPVSRMTPPLLAIVKDSPAGITIALSTIRMMTAASRASASAFASAACASAASAVAFASAFASADCAIAGSPIPIRG